LISGKPRFSYGKYVFWYPEILKQVNETNSSITEDNLIGRIVPVYSDLM
jgi:hypothetical protein